MVIAAVNGRHDLVHTLPADVGKDRCVVEGGGVFYFDDYRVTPAPHSQG